MSVNSQLKEVAKHSTVFGIGNMLQQGVSILLLPVYVSRISTEDYGILNLLLIGATLIGLLSKSAIGPAIFRSYYDYEDKSSKQMVVTTAFTYVAAIALSLTAIAWVFSDKVSFLLTGDSSHWRLARFVILTGTLASMNDVALTVFRARKMSKRYMTISVVQLIVSLIVVIYLVVFKGHGIEGIVIGRLIGASVGCAASLWSIREELKGKISSNELKKMLAYGIPHIPENIAAFFANAGSRILLRVLVGPAGVGVYALAYRIASIVQSTFIVPFNLIAPATVFSMEKKKEATLFYSKLFFNYVLITGSMSVLASVLTKPVLSLFAQSDYVAAWRTVPFLAFALVAYGARGLVSIPLMLKRKTFWFPIAFSVGAIFNIGSMLLIIPELGVAGAGISLLLGNTVVCYLRNRLASRYMKQELHWGKILGVALLFVAVILVGNIIDLEHNIAELIVRLIFASSILFFLPRFLGLVTKEDIVLQQEVLKSILARFRLRKR